MDHLTQAQYDILRNKATEPPFNGEYTDNKEPGVYKCAGCGQALFSSDAKFDSNSGWPSFYKPIDEDSVCVAADDSHGMQRNEVLCSKCDGHLGHVFNDEPNPTGLRYCINSGALNFDSSQ